MTIEVTAKCDGGNCKFNQELDLTGFEESDYDEVLEDFGWSIDSVNECHYCSSCVKKMKANSEL